jgi:hypothetical protein
MTSPAQACLQSNNVRRRWFALALQWIRYWNGTASAKTLRRSHMSFAKTAAALIAVLAVLIALSPVTYGQDANRTNPGGKETAMTGCLSKSGTPGEYTLTDEKTGTTTTVMGPDALEKHSANHKVELTGTESTHDGKKMFHATKI